jgi:DNA-binding transcriptional MerR regulator
MPYKEKEIEKLYYTIGEVAKMFNMSISHLRFWSNEMDVIKPVINKKGNRMYTVEDIDAIRNIHSLIKERGLSLKGAVVELKAMKKKMKLEAKAVASLSEPVTPTLFDGDTTTGSQNDFVNYAAVKHSLTKMKASLLEIHHELELLKN